MSTTSTSRPRARDFGLVCGTLPPGALNAITDVAGVRVGHRTLLGDGLATGVTAILPHGGNIFRDKPVAACEVINGFGKSLGLVQLQELGLLETPVLLTNTLSVAACAEGLVRHAIATNPDIGRTTSTANPVVGECHDGPINDIQALAVSAMHAIEAIEAAVPGPVAEGNVGGGTGMTCFGFKGGIGTASRRLELAGGRHLGVLVQANFGRAGDLVLPDGRRPRPGDVGDAPERGSIMMVLATDVPLDQRQLERVIRRCGAGIARLGAFWGHGSGDIAIGFTTANRVDHDDPGDTMTLTRLNNARIDLLFRAAAETTEEAILNALCAAAPLAGRDGRIRPSLGDWLADHRR
ncbi:MAG: P1 family peptidase [Rhodospirillales bacterium]|nr:P1 family peptidase [Rhodospirillales bacterium]